MGSFNATGSGLEFQAISPLRSDYWDDIVPACEETSVFHTAAWARVLSYTYGYKPHYKILKRNGDIAGVIPMMYVSSWLTGKRIVCLPFSDHCSPLVCWQEFYENVFEHFVITGKELKCRYAEIRCNQPYPKYPHHEFFLRHTLNLAPNEKDIFSRFRKGTKSSIKQARKKRIAVDMDCSLNALKKFYDLHCQTRRRHGLPPQPFRFFENIHRFLLTKGKGFIATAFLERRPIASAIFFIWREHATYKFSASDAAFKKLNPTNLILWETIRHLIGKGYKSLCMGRTEPENLGLVRFKRGWGAQEQGIYYYRYDIKSDRFLSENKRFSNSAGLANIFFKAIPASPLKFIGRLLYKHMG